MDECEKVSLLRPLKKRRYYYYYSVSNNWTPTIWKTLRCVESRIKYHFCLQGVYNWIGKICINRSQSQSLVFTFPRSINSVLLNLYIGPCLYTSFLSHDPIRLWLALGGEVEATSVNCYYWHEFPNNHKGKRNGFSTPIPLLNPFSLLYVLFSSIQQIFIGYLQK